MKKEDNFKTVHFSDLIAYTEMRTNNHVTVILNVRVSLCLLECLCNGMCLYYTCNAEYVNILQNPVY